MAKQISRFFMFFLMVSASILLIVNVSYSESVFLKDGSIIEGKIIKETNRSMKLKMANGLNTEVPRNRILRTLYTDGYKKKVYIYMSNGSSIQGHIVFEDKTSYTVRKNLSSSKEIKIRKNKISGIMKNRIKTGGITYAEEGTHGEVRSFGGIEFVFIKGGEFMMGASDENGSKNEYPRHKVKVNSFWIGKYEITQKQYKKYFDIGSNNYKGDNYPVDFAKWKDTMNFCREFSNENNIKSRLPYEAEWEYAARAGTSTNYYWGSKMDGSYAWYNDNSGGFFSKKPHPVGKKKPNKWGLHDMIGNVYEWCMDWYGSGYYLRSNNDNPNGPKENNADSISQGVSTIKTKVRRSGNYKADSDDLKISTRKYGALKVDEFYPDDRNLIPDKSGFRLVLPTK